MFKLNYLIRIFQVILNTYMIKKKIKILVIFGSGLHAKICLNEFLKTYVIEKVFFFDKLNYKTDIQVLNKKIILIKNFQNLKKITNRNTYFFLGIGDNILRKKIYDEVISKIEKLKWLRLLSKDTIIDKSVKIGEGTAIMPGVVINFQTIIKDHCIINTSSSIDHDCFVDSFVNLSPGVNVAGNVKIERFTKIGIGASVSHNLNIKQNVVIGANSFVNKDCETNKTYYGIPIKAYNQKEDK